MSISSTAFKGGFSFRDNVVGKPPNDSLQGLMLGDDWIWAPNGQPEQLLNAVAVKGYAITPAKWRNGYKSKKKGTFIESSYLLLDYDANLSWDDAKKHPFFTQYACFAYTSASHGLVGKGDRFRIVFALDHVVTDHDVFDRLIDGVSSLCPGSDPAINAASLLYGNPGAEVHVYDLNNRMDTKSVYFHWAVNDAHHKLRRQSFFDDIQARGYSDDSSFSRVRYWLNNIPNVSRSTWVRVAGCLRNIEGHGYEWAYQLFEEWSARDYADFDPDACEKLWESMDSNPGGFRKLKEYFLYFKENEGENDYLPSRINTTSKIQKRIDTLNTEEVITDGNAYSI